MKKFFLLTIALSLGSFMFSQECDMYFASREGATLEYKSYNAKDKQQSSMKQTVVKRSSVPGGVLLTIESQVMDGRNKEPFRNQYNVKCENGVFTVEMKSFLGPNSQQKNDAQSTIEADNLDLPKNPKPGDALKGGSVRIKMGSQNVPMMNLGMSITISNRKVDAIEEITTPAGTFKCVKISYDVESKFGFAVRSKGMEWYCKDVGMVRSEAKDKSGKLTSYTVLTAFNK